MDSITELLVKAASLEKKAYEDFVDEFVTHGIISLVEANVDFTEASNMIKKACEEHPQTSQLRMNYMAFEKTAAYVKELEEKLEDLHRGELIAPLEKLADCGFSEDELADMQVLPASLIEKIASVKNAPEPAWSMGKGVGMEMAVEKMDPITAFALGY